jgi:mannose-1-phosphate guanylyltransferase
MSEWTGWAVIEEGRGLVYVKQDHQWPEVGEFTARQELRERLAMGHAVRLTRVRIIESSPPPQPDEHSI